jgi:hypothetical protein
MEDELDARDAALADLSEARAADCASLEVREPTLNALCDETQTAG